MPKLAEDRHRALLKDLRSGKGVRIVEAAERLGVSPMTVRRDLTVLEEQGLVQRVHGGAVPSPAARFGERLSTRARAKARAAAKLARFLPREGAIYLDGSTTMLHLVSRLAGARGVQVATNNVETFRRLTSVRGVEPLLIGGQLDRRTDNLVGGLALRSILATVFDAAFFSAWGLAPRLGPMEVTLEDAEVKDLVASRSRAVYLAVDAKKLGVTAPGAWRPDQARTLLATDLSDKDARLRPYRAQFRRIL